MIQFIEVFKDQFGVEPICATLGGTERGFLTARGYRAAKSRPASARALRDGILIGELRRIHGQNYSVYGIRKMHAAMTRAGWLVGRDQVARLMRKARLRGVTRGRKVVTTTPAAHAVGRFPDLVKRRFTAHAPNRLWVADITYVATWSGFAYVAFVTDACTRKIVGWNVSSRLTTEMLPLQALEMASWAATDDLTGLVHHSDHASQGGFNWLSQHLVVMEVLDGSSSAGSGSGGACEVEVSGHAAVAA